MPVCEVCGNNYDKAFDIHLPFLGGEKHTFDSFECAIHRLAPTCKHCGCRIIGHGIETPDAYYCCASCAELSGVDAPVDRVR